MDFQLVCSKCGAVRVKTNVQDRFTGETYFRKLGWTVVRNEPVECTVCTLESD